MPANLTISVRADVAESRAQLALVQSDIRSLTRSLATAANEARSADLGGAVTDQMRMLATQIEAGRLEIAKLNADLRETSTSGFSRFNGAIKEAAGPIAMLGSQLRQGAEAFALFFAVNKAREFASAMGELGERTVNMAAAVGTTPHEFSALSGALRLVGGDADTAGRTLERIGKNIESALTEKASQAAKAANSLGISQAQLKEASTNLGFALDLLADKFTEFANSPLKSADFLALTGRSMDQLVPLLRQGSAGFEELKAKAAEAGIVLSDQDATAMAETGEKLNLLSATLEGEGVQGFLHFRGAINTAIDGLTSFIKTAGAAVAAITTLSNAEDQAEHLRLQREGKLNEPGGPGIFGTTGAAGRAVHPSTTGFAQSGATEGGGPAAAGADQDFSASGALPQVAPWPTGGGRGRRGGAGGANRDYEDFAEGERLKLEAARGNTQQINAIYDEWLARAAAQYGQDSIQYKRIQLDKANAARQASHEIAAEAEQAYAGQRSADSSYLAAFRANMTVLVAEHKITKQQEFGFDAEYTGQLRDELAKQLQAIISNDNLAVADRRRAWQEMQDLMASENAKIAEDSAKAAQAVSTNWTEGVKQISDQFATMATDVLTGTKTMAAAIDALLKSLIKDTLGSAFKGLFNTLLTGTGGSGGSGLGGSGGGIGGGIGSSLGGGLLSMLGGSAAKGLIGGGLGSAFGGLFGGSAGAGVGIEATDVASMWGGGGADAVQAGLGGAVGGGGLFSGIGSLFTGLLGLFEKGGIASAARGWIVPSFQSGGILSMLHENEMVLPSNISQGLQGLYGSGGGSSGHTFNISAVDASSVAKLFANNGSALVSAMNSAMRNGSALRTSS